MSAAGDANALPIGRRLRRNAGRWTLNVGAAAAFIFILLPLIFVTWLSFYQQEIPSFPPTGYSTRWYAEAAANSRFIKAFVLSVQVGFIATAIGLLLALPASIALTRFSFKGRAVINNLLLMPLVIPGIVLGIALYVFQVEAENATDLPIMGSFAGLVFGHTLLVIPWALRLICASLVGFDRTLEEAAQNLGATAITAFRKVTIPAILPGVVAGGMFGFVSSIGNLELSLFLVVPGQTTLPIAILQNLEWKIDPTIAAISVLQILIIVGAMLVTDRFVRISRVV
ncbi:ABC transporter permease [Bradyrhizobium iriomotense]|uniref:ABC transporter permease n=1 Tax=Bradyrhizobium iriomotense TaxID=441950 RepID=A0ABQ6B2A2_9BRAD|nr:ABC transporter permease [Bradyrhizobium iriomotense]